MDHPLVTQIERTGYPHFTQATGEMCEECLDRPAVTRFDGYNVCRSCQREMKEAGV